MATCADCIHVEVCRMFVTDIAKFTGHQMDDPKKLEAEMDIDGCEHFRDRGRFMELPCKVVNRTDNLDGYIGNCPKCHTNVMNVENYCWNCGQALDWDENESGNEKEREMNET